MASVNGYTPTQKKLLEILADGKAHSRHELHAAICDEYDSMVNMQFHISAIRKRLPEGEKIICELIVGTTHYRRIKETQFHDLKS